MRDQLTAPERDIYSISRLNDEVSRLLSGSFPLLWIEGEISNFSQPRSGHMYFSLKDATAQVRAAMFRNNNLFLRFKPETGMQVLVRARVSLYEPRGDYQLIVEHMEEAGDGALRRAFEQIKQKLQAEGLFASENKLALPEYPQRLGIITSPTGAAIRDVLSVLKRRYPRLPVLIYPVAVQGDSAAREIVQALRLANQRADCDVLLLTRGGGSLEDLQAFNDESVARAVAASSIPVVCGIGHEIDYTIADFAADLRAPTPSAAAELISPDTTQLQQRLMQRQSALQRAIEHWLTDQIETVGALQKRLQRLHPQQKLNSQNQRLDELENRLQRALQTLLQKKQDFMNSLLRSLDTVSPLNTLKRGYAIVTQSNTEQPLISSNHVIVGEKLNVRLAEGRLQVKVEKK
ncbi:MAG: exodeoxyribonuclease VII large subunit [Gammaproteobacteria bacterium]|nr:exodeoxyribonuclease VII large subunit [Gammaproteobacteria bacterium]